MLGLLVILVISWGLLYGIYKEHISVLGILPNPRRLLHFFTGLLYSFLIIGINIFLESQLKEMNWKANPYEIIKVWNALIYHLKSALTEELIFRGAVLHILIKKLGAFKAIMLSSVIFGVYHWFSYGIFNERWILLFYIFLITGLNGWVWAYSFHKTKSILLGLGLHLGGNLMMSFFYESQPYGEILFSVQSQREILGWSGFFFSFFKGLFPGICMLFLVMFIVRIENITIENTFFRS